MAPNQGMAGNQPHGNVPNVPPNYNNTTQPPVGQPRMYIFLSPSPSNCMLKWLEVI